MPARGQLYINRKLVASIDMPYSVLNMFGTQGLTCGYDGGEPRRAGGVLTADRSASPGTIKRVTMDLSGELIQDREADMKIAMRRNKRGSSSLHLTGSPAKRSFADLSSHMQGVLTMLDLPLEYALIGFEGDKFSGKIVPELLDLAQRGIVRFVDIVFIQKEEDGSTGTIELNDLAPEWYELFVPMGEHVSSLFTTDDLAIAASRLPNNSAALLILWENLWVANLRKAIVDAGGQLVERAQIAPEVVEQFVQALAAE